MTKRKARRPVTGCVGHDCAACRKRETERRKLLAVAKLADELTNAIDLAEEDIGGARPVQDILADLGPAVDKLGSVLK